MAFPLPEHGRRPNCVFRSSLPGPPMPLSTLHPAPRGTQRKTRGQDGSLLLSCGALSSPTTRRFIPTIALAAARGSEELGHTLPHGRQGSDRWGERSHRLAPPPSGPDCTGCDSGTFECRAPLPGGRGSAGSDRRAPERVTDQRSHRLGRIAQRMTGDSCVVKGIQGFEMF
jgi:hypothetical protein